MKNLGWKEVQGDGKRRGKCVGSGNVKGWRKKKEEERNKDNISF